MVSEVAPAHGGEVHRDITGGGARASVFGISDGLVTNVSLILGVAGASVAPSFVRIAGLAGLLGGAFSMAAGEYISMRAQVELFERELAIERREIEQYPAAERQELIHIYRRRGISETLAVRLADDMMADKELALETHAREELGIDPGSLGSPVQAAVASFVAFATGAVIPLIPYLVGLGRSAALVLAIVLAGTAALVVGALLGTFTGRNRWISGLRSLAVAAAAGSVTFAVGALIGVASGHS
jgi:VIT1/CCC1 family predicted Fe2+/Mn2+ transporter